MRPKIKSLIIMVVILIMSLLFFVFNQNNVGKKPIILKLSNSVASHGDEITITGNYFGGEISRGRVYIDGKMVYKDFIKSWNNREIIFTLTDDFSSGMITIVTMFGESNPYLITSIDDVPDIADKEGIAGFPHISNIRYANDSNLKIILEGSGFGINRGSSYITIEEITGKRVNFKQSAITLWQDDRVEFYIPYIMNNISISIINYRGSSNEVSLHSSGIPTVLYLTENHKRYQVKQKLDIVNMISLKNSYLETYLPGIYEDINQYSLKSNMSDYFDVEKNLYHFLTDIYETGQKYSVEIIDEILLADLEVKVRSEQLTVSYDKNSPDYKEGFKDTPGIVFEKGLTGAAKWIVRNTSNRYNQVELILNWILRYVKVTEDGSIDSDKAYLNRSRSGATEFGLVNTVIAMFRAVGIPTRLISGVDISNEAKTYKWLEFYLPGGGWVPVDVLTIRGDSEYPIGKIDGNKLCFSKGYAVIDYEISNFDPTFYAVQNCITKSQGNIESYDAIWHNVDIIELQE